MASANIMGDLLVSFKSKNEFDQFAIMQTIMCLAGILHFGSSFYSDFDKNLLNSMQLTV